jgi:hypothetical protein
MDFFFVLGILAIIIFGTPKLLEKMESIFLYPSQTDKQNYDLTPQERQNTSSDVRKFDRTNVVLISIVGILLFLTFVSIIPIGIAFLALSAIFLIGFIRFKSLYSDLPSGWRVAIIYLIIILLTIVVFYIVSVILWIFIICCTDFYADW